MLVDRRKTKTLVIATHNQDKLLEIRRLLKDVSLTVKGLNAFPPAYTVRETGKTLVDNALLKARKALRHTGCLSLADDTGLEVLALDGRPGVYSARFAGSGCDYQDNNRKILRLLKGVPLSRRRAVFRCVVALAHPDGTERVFEGRCRGWITEEARGNHGFGYDPVFEPLGEKKTFAELSLERKNDISHRSLALKKTVAWLSRQFP